MHITFRIKYFTVWGQRLRITSNIDKMSGMNEEHAPDMHLVSPESGLWEFSVDIPRQALNLLKYRYFVEDENQSIRIYECDDRQLKVVNENCKNAVIHDTWRATDDQENTLFSSAFTKALLKPEKIWKDTATAFPLNSDDDILIRFQIHVARIERGQRVGLTGNADALGGWNTAKSILMTNEGHPQWQAEVRLSKSEFPLHYKYFIYDENNDTFLFFEAGEDRYLPSVKESGSDTLFIQGDERFLFPMEPWKGAGIAIPVFSLRRKEGYGVGEFTDIKMLVDWARKVGMKMIQILPVNDTVATHTWTDSYPYAAISVYALHPIYANIEKMGRLKSETANNIVKERGLSLNKNSKLDYEGVMQLKSRYFKMLYDEQKEQFLKDRDFNDFFEKNKYWLKPYAAFSYLRDLFNTPNFEKWGPYRNYSETIVEEITSEKSEHYDDIAIHYFIQYHLHKQLYEAAEYARQNGVILKGDIPIGIYRNSVDAWVEPQLYNLDKQAGAPPDDFSENGQNWGFPTYNWQEMARDKYRWWRNRLQKMAEYFDAFRIDHILGFFRIWEIPIESVEGVMGYFNPSLAYDTEELQQRGIMMDEERFCKPYIREHFLHERFGDLTDVAKQHYLDEYAPGHFQLKQEVNTQRKIADIFSAEPSDSVHERMTKERLKEGLMSLVAEVVFIENPYGSKKSYFPRSTLHYMRSFQELDNEQKHLINELYMDYFYSRNEDLWKQQANIKLPALKKATNMLICGEDLGMVPAVVPEVMDNLGILSLEIQRMPKDTTKDFNHPNDYPWLSVASTSTHDMPTIRGWWEEDPERAQVFFNSILGNDGNSPFFCEPWIVKQILDQHFYSPSMWVVIPLQDLMGADGNIRRKDAREERINVPSNPNHYWRYRLHLSLEEMMQQDEFNGMVYNLVKDSGRMSAY